MKDAKDISFFKLAVFEQEIKTVGELIEVIYEEVFKDFNYKYCSYQETIKDVARFLTTKFDMTYEKALSIARKGAYK